METLRFMNHGLAFLLVHVLKWGRVLWDQMENVNWGDSLLRGLSSSGDGLYWPYRAEGHIRLGSYIDPWRWGENSQRNPAKQNQHCWVKAGVLCDSSRDVLASEEGMFVDRTVKNLLSCTDHIIKGRERSVVRDAISWVRIRAHP